MTFTYGVVTAVIVYLLSIFGSKIIRWWRKLDDDDRYFFGIMLNTIGGICVLAGIPVFFAYLIYRNIMYGEHLPFC